MSADPFLSRLRRDPRVLLCGFDGFPGCPDNPAAFVVGALSLQAWAPDRARIDYRIVPTTWSGAVEAVADALRETGADAVMVVGVASGAESFRVETLASNRARIDLPDAAGAVFPTTRIASLGPAVARTSAPVAPLVEAILAEGLPACASSDAGDYLCNYTFYRLLTEVACGPQAPPAAFLHFPTHLEPHDLERGVKAAAARLARTLAAEARTQTLVV